MSRQCTLPRGARAAISWFGWMVIALRAWSADAPVPAAADPAPGHSWHGEAFDQGPRQNAYLMDGMPALQFPVTTTNELAQRFFEQGIGQLHGFWYFEAERTFRRVHQLDTNCAMAFWGMAMANVRNENRARTFVTNAVALAAGASPRERAYIESLKDFYQEEKDGKKREMKARRRDWIRAYEDIVRTYPEDLEAKAFLIYQTWDNSGFGNNTDLPISSHMAVDALARQILEKAPLHPVHHFRIHLWDPERATEALDSAARCGQGSPGIAHMWHMPGHTYAKLCRHHDAAWQQEASARVDHAHMIRDRVLPDQIHNYAHNNEWLAESWSYVGRVHDAIDLSKNMVELPRLYRTNAALATSPLAHPYSYSGSSWSLGRASLLLLLPRFELWDDLLALAQTPYLEPTDSYDERAQLARALALAWFARGDTNRAQQQQVLLQDALKSLRAERQAAVDLAEQNARKERKSQADITKAMTEALEKFNGPADRLESYAAELRIHAALAAGDTNAVTAELDLAKEIPEEQIAPLHWRAGQIEKALESARKAADKATNQVQPIALLADLQWRSGKTNDAQASFQRLRQIQALPDLNLPVIQRLQPIAQSLGLPEDWRSRHPERDDVGQRPPLDSLGPLHWHPASAPGWNLVDAQGKESPMSELRGRPFVALFYLGRGCPHCLEQLNRFAPAFDAYQKAGIAVVAISTDAVEGVRRTLQRGSQNAFPFPLLANPDLSAFKSWRAYDDFEAVPLHGTFLVDAKGRIRWQDIGPEPFMDPDFLLTEARRLLQMNDRIQVAGNQ
ncbi:MAG: redoxin domain-containing protein [Verrucomicrobiales bacterium]|nr:redoxin domain-containing protein [Verrucomicrobiales bacterium]